MVDHTADPKLAVPGARGNYLLYVRTMRRAFAGAASASGVGLALYGIRVQASFEASPAEGWSALVELFYGLVATLVLICVVYLACWVPALIRVTVLRHRLPDSQFFLLSAIPNFWDRLTIVDPSHDPGNKIPNATISLSGERMTVWRGVLSPRIAAELPVRQLVNVETDRPGGIPFKRRIIALTFALGEVTEELPVALRRVAGGGLIRLSSSTEHEVVSHLWLISDSSARDTKIQRGT